MAKISQYFKDKAKTIKDYPKTLIKAVYGDDGKRLDNIISDITSNIDSTKAKIGTTDISKYGDGTVTGGLSMLSNNAYDLKMLGWTVPKECPVQNYVDEDGVFHQIVGRVDLSKLMWEWADTLNEFRTDRYIMGMNLDSTNIYCSKYQFGSEMYISGMGIYIKDPNYDSSTISQFKADNKGVYFYYELATEITKPIDGNEAIKLLNDKLGNTNISGIGDGTVTGGLNTLNSNLSNLYQLDYDKAVPLSLGSAGDQFYPTENGFILLDISVTDASNGYAIWMTDSQTDIYKLVATAGYGTLAQIFVVKNENVGVRASIGVTVNSATFVPFKLYK